MRIRGGIVLGIFLLFGTRAFAQDYPKVEAGLNYTYMRFNPENQVGNFGAFSLNGGGGDLTYFLTKSFGIKAEFGGTTSQTQTVTLNVAPCQAPPCKLSTQGNLFTYNALVVYKARAAKFEPFLEAGFGGAHTNYTANIVAACGTGCSTARAPSNNSFDFIVGGGIDIPVTKSIAIRPAQFDFLLTRFDTGFTTSNQNQSNFRYQGGIVFRF